MRVKEINALSAEDRASKLADLRIELARIRTMVNAGGAVENPTRIRNLRRTIAQILTIQNEKKLGIHQPAEEKEKKSEKKVAKPVKASEAKKQIKEKTVSK
jgi:large subunit ribosomal protein L29